MVKKNTIEEILKKLNFFFESFFYNIYEYYTKGIGYNILKYQKKTKYRFRASMVVIKDILERENSEKIKEEILTFYTVIEKKNKESLRNTNWLKAKVITNSCVLQNICIKEILKQISEKIIDIEKIEKKVFDQLVETRWDYEKILEKKFPHREFSCLEKSITAKKKKKELEDVVAAYKKYIEYNIIENENSFITLAYTKELQHCNLILEILKKKKEGEKISYTIENFEKKMSA